MEYFSEGEGWGSKNQTATFNNSPQINELWVFLHSKSKES